MSHHFAFIQQVTVHDLGAFNRFGRDRVVNTDLLSAFVGVFLRLFTRDRAIIYYNVIERDLGRVVSKELQVR